MTSLSPPHVEPRQQQDDRAATPPSSSHDADGSVSFDSGSSQHGATLDNDNDASFASNEEPEARHPRARRKRTGAHDKQILEEAYQTNKKPDKQARLEIVNRVSLTEKEVQVWFQNRRQNDRRKARPLTPRELADLQYNGIRLVNVDDGGSKHESVLKVTHGPVTVDHPSDSHPSSPFENPVLPPQEHDSVAHGHSRSFSEAATQRHDQDVSSQESHVHSHGQSNSFSGVGYLANRRRETGSFSTPSSQTSQSYNSFSYRVEGVNRSSPNHHYTPPQSGSHSSTPQSQMRISCSLEGKAEIISGNEPPSSSMPELQTQSQSSPSEFTTPWPRELRRSQSAITPGSSEGVQLPPISSLINQTVPPRLPLGRSRDVEAWESCAASQTRDALTTFAENESNGSAAAKISLIRSTSSTGTSSHPSRDSGHGNALRPSSSSKRNAPLPASRDERPLHKRAKHNSTAKTLFRQASGTDDAATTPVEVTKKANASQEAEELKETDSDKENWSPAGDQWSERRPYLSRPSSRRPLPSGPAGAPRDRNILGDNSDRARPSLLKARANTAPVRRGRGHDKAVEIFVDGDEQQRGSGASSPDPEVQRFMGEATSPRKGEMEVVEGLLSLSKGAWR